jgi:putative transcriptional regulator
MFQDGRARIGWSQTQLAQKIGVSRQWVSLVERGKTSVEFDLVVGALQALGYRLFVETSDLPAPDEEWRTDHPGPSVHSPSPRTPLTRRGEPLGRQRARRRPKQNRNE